VVQAQLSVVIPTWNRRVNLLKRTLYTLVNQSMPPTEIIVSDTSSDEKCIKDAKSLERDCIRVIHNPLPTFSLSRSFNIGIKHTSEESEYILCTGAEMLFGNDFLQKLFVSMDETKFAVGCCGFLPKDTKYPDSLTIGWHKLLAQVIPNTSNKMSPGTFQCASRAWWFKVRGYDEKLPFAFVDSDILQRGKMSGLKRIEVGYNVAQVLHQWHETSDLVGKLGGDLKYVKAQASAVRNPSGWGEI